MIKFWKIIFLSIIISSFNLINNIRMHNTVAYQVNSINDKPLYKNINQNFNNYGADVNKANAGSNVMSVSGIGTIFYWNQFANSWEDFKNNYNGLDLTINMEIAFNWYNVKWNSSNLYIPLNNIKTKNNWFKVTEVIETTTQWGRWDSTNAKLSYTALVSGNAILIRFKLETWSTNNYDRYYYSIDTRNVKCNSSFDYNSIKALFDEKINNKTLILDSDYSTSLQDYRNLVTEETAITKLLQDGLGNYYHIWKSLIGIYTYSDKTNQATITVKFNDPNNNQEVLWTFKVNIKFNLTQNYWTKSFKERLTITAGNVIDVDNPNQKMIIDKPLIWNGKEVYGTTAFVRFDAAPDGSETMKINGIPIQVINNQFTFQMTDNQTHETNEYHILLEKHDVNDFSKIIAKYEIQYLIKQNIPELALKWYAWNPDKNPDQKKLITPILNDGMINSNYGPEVNVKTGTKTQIMWVKNQALKPFPLDPLNKSGNIIADNNYDQGFLAEGAVSGMGITQNFNDAWIKTVTRVKVDETTLQPIAMPEEIKSDNQGSYFSIEGTYLYTITDQKNIATSKFIKIGQRWQNKYAKFLDVLNNPQIAVDFWTTLQGFHLKHYLVQYKQFNSKNIQKLQFEQVVSYWKEYVSNVKSQQIGPDSRIINMIDLNNIILDDIKMNYTSFNKIRNDIINNVSKQLQKYNLEYNHDYQIINFELSLNQLLQFDFNNNSQITLNISALATSTKARNSNVIKVRNSKAYDSDKIIDLAKIKFDLYQFNFSKFEVEQLQYWILRVINNKFQNLELNLNYQSDYEINPFDISTLKDFINNKTTVTLNFVIKSQLSSNNIVNSTLLTLINNLDSEIAPIDPPIPKIDPNIVIKWNLFYKRKDWMMLQNLKKNKWKLLFSIVIIPVTFLLFITVTGIISTIIKTASFKVQILLWWTNALAIKYFSLSAISLSCFLYFYFAYKICKQEKKEAQIKASNKVDFGKTKWLTEKQLHKSYPLISDNVPTDNHGFVVNTSNKKQVLFNVRSNTHCLVIGGTGSGKTQGLVLPTIKVNGNSAVKPSMIITDPKGELYQIQAKMLEEKGYEIKVLNLREANKSMSWNPLQVIYDQFVKMLLQKKEQEKAFLRVEVQTNIQDLCKTIFNKKFVNEPFWNESGALIIEAIILGILEDLENYLIENKINKTQAIIKAIKEQLPNNKFNLASITIIVSMRDDMIKWFQQRSDTSIAKIIANQVLHGESKTLTSILMAISTNLALFKNDLIRNLTCRNDLKMMEFINKPTALFIIVPDENYNYYLFVSLLISQIYKFLIKQASTNITGKLSRPVYFLCDEFGNIPPILNMDIIITIARSRNIFFQLIIQDLQQIVAKYSKETANIILANCSLHIFLQTMDLDTAERYSKMIGETTVL